LTTQSLCQRGPRTLKLFPINQEEEKNRKDLQVLNQENELIKIVVTKVKMNVTWVTTTMT